MILPFEYALKSMYALAFDQLYSPFKLLISSTRFRWIWVGLEELDPHTSPTSISGSICAVSSRAFLSSSILASRFAVIALHFFRPSRRISTLASIVFNCCTKTLSSSRELSHLRRTCRAISVQVFFTSSSFLLYLNCCSAA